jgi:hypothetical protein
MDSAAQTQKAGTKSSTLAALLAAFEKKAAKKGNGFSDKSFAAHLSENTSQINGLHTHAVKSPGTANLAAVVTDQEIPDETDAISPEKFFPATLSNSESASAPLEGLQVEIPTTQDANRGQINPLIHNDSPAPEMRFDNSISAATSFVARLDTTPHDPHQGIDDLVFYGPSFSIRNPERISIIPFMSEKTPAFGEKNNDRLQTVSLQAKPDILTDNDTIFQAEDGAAKKMNPDHQASANAIAGPADGISIEADQDIHFLQDILTAFLNTLENKAPKMNINHSEVINAEAGFAAVSKSEATIASSKKTEHDTVNPLTANQGAPANTADHKIAALKHHLAAILQIMGSEKPAEELNPENTKKAQAGFAIVSGSEAAVAPQKITESDTAKPAKVAQTVPAASADHKIAALKDHLTAILQAMEPDTPVETLKTEPVKEAKAGFATVSGSEAAVAPKKITESDTAKPAAVAQTVPAASADHKIAALKDHLTAILQAMEPDTPVETLKTEPVKEAKAGFATVSGSEAAVAPPKKAQSDTVNPFTANHTIPTASADRHMAPIKEILKAFVQAIDHEATTLNQKSGHMTLLRPGAGNVILPAVEGELPAAGKTADGHQKTENTREAFIARVAEFLQTKDAQGRSITDMITRVRNLTDQTKTAPNAKIRNTSLPTTGAHHQETAAQGSRMETAKSVFIADSEKPAVPNNAASSMSSAQEGKLAAGHYILEDAPISAPVIFRSKHHDASTMPADRGAVTGATAVFSDLLTTDAKAAPQGARMQSLIDQIAQAKQQMDRDFGRVRITLTPPNMGTVDMDVIVRQNRVEVTLISDNASVQQLLSAHADDVKSALQRQDMKIDSFQVFLQTNQDGSQQPSNPWASMQGRGEQGNAYTPGRDETADTPPLMEEEPVPSTRGLVSIFV